MPYDPAAVPMSNLLYEVLLRLAKAGAAAVIGLVVFLVAIGPLGQPTSLQLALLCWLSGGVFILLVETSPI